MKRIGISALVVALLAGAFAISGVQKTAERAEKSELQIDIEGQNPWTHLRVNNDKFQFVVMSDRTGGNRGRVFSQAIDQINLMQPTFVLCVGDLIQGYSKDKPALAKQWKELQSYTSKLQMPFFYVPGNHDMANSVESEVWKERFGRSYYHFRYSDVLFLAVNSDDPNEGKEKGQLSKEQIEYFQKVLKDNPTVRWIFVLVHKPLWTHANIDTNGWLELEKALNGRQYTVFSGHKHHYLKFTRQGMNYYQLATTGGGSRLRGLRYGEFDHFAWVTVKGKNEPIIANLMLDGIYPENLKKPISDEPGEPVNRKAVHPVRGKVMVDGTPAADAQITFWRPDPSDKDGKKASHAGDALVEADGTYTLTTYVLNDGLPEGEYKVTVTLRNPMVEPSGKMGPNLLPARYATHQVTELRAVVKTGSNEINFDLMSK